MSVLFFHTMRYKVQDPRNAANDRFILSKVGLLQGAALLHCSGCQTVTVPGNCCLAFQWSVETK